MTAVTVHEAAAPVYQAEAPGTAVLAVIARAAADPGTDVAKMGALLDLQERILAKASEMEFARDFAAASLEMPRVAKRGVIDMGAKGSIPFAKYEDLDRAIRPVELRYGFTRSFLTEPSGQPGVVMTCKLTHRAGHSERSSRQMPPDPGPGRNAMQAIGSASSYAKRYLTLDIWNIITEGADDDAQSTDYITDEQAMQIRDLITDAGMNADRTAALLKSLAAASVEKIHGGQYQLACNLIAGEKRRKR